MEHYLFFSSYKRTDQGNVPNGLMDFLNDVQDELRAPDADQDPFFIDRRQLNVGDDWNNKLIDALNNSASLVCFLSDRYLESQPCQQERAFFQRRIELARNHVNAIIPVIWEVSGWSREDVPEELATIQYDEDGLPDTYQKHGLSALVDLERPQAGENYKTMVRKVVSWIQNAAQSPLPPVRFKGGLSDLITSGGTRSNIRIRAIVVAGTQGEIQLTGPRLESYPLDAGGSWRPYYPLRDAEIGIWCNRLATEREYYIVEWAEKPNGSLSELVTRAIKDHGVVLCLVDPRTAALERYCTWIRTLTEVTDGQNRVAVVAVWREEDLNDLEQNQILKHDLSLLLPWTEISFLTRLVGVKTAITFEEQIRQVMAELEFSVGFSKSPENRRQAFGKGPNIPPTIQRNNETRAPAKDHKSEWPRGPLDRHIPITGDTENKGRLPSVSAIGTDK